ncbi:MAG: NUDIX hydrolase [Pseudomonadaceae bacterium]|nr:NUDIX hydrolase [Pseudomonadaceae bacterium]
MKPADRKDSWLDWVKKIHAIAGTGQHFAASEFDRERYDELNDIATMMLAQLADSTPQAIKGLFTDHGEGYSTPKVEVRGAVFDGESDRILLVQEKADGLWCLPGGFTEVGLSPRQNIIKEIREEAGIDVTVGRLFALKHKIRHNYTPDVRDFYKLFLLCEDPRGDVPIAGMETSDARYFPIDALPPLSEGRTIADDIHLAVRHRDEPTLACYVD